MRHKVNLWIYIYMASMMVLHSCKYKLDCNQINKNYFYLVKNLRSKEDTLTFISSVSELLEKDPHCPKAYQVKANLELCLGFLDSSRVHFLQALKLDTTSVFTLYNLASLYNLDENNDSALHYLNRAIFHKTVTRMGIDNNNLFINYFDIPSFELYFLRGTINQDKGYFIQSKIDFEFLESKRYDLKEVYANLSQLHFRIGNMDSACRYYGMALQIGTPETFLDPKIKTMCVFEKK